MGYTEVMLISVIGIQLLKSLVLHKHYGRKKGEFIAANLMLFTIPLVWLSDAGKGMGIYLKWILILSVMINWIYSLYDYKYKKQQRH